MRLTLFCDGILYTYGTILELNKKAFSLNCQNINKAIDILLTFILSSFKRGFCQPNMINFSSSDVKFTLTLSSDRTLNIYTTS